MHIHHAGLVLHQVVAHPDVVEVGRDEHRRVRLLRSEHLGQHRPDEVLEPRVIVGGEGVARYPLEHLQRHSKRTAVSTGAYRVLRDSGVEKPHRVAMGYVSTRQYFDI